MRFLIASAALAAAVLAGTAAQAEKRLFIVANSNGYGVDRCLASGAVCGVAAADSYCRSHEFVQVLSYRKVERDDITGAIPSTGACHNPGCDEFVAIECSR
jgi:hypothetical protein